MLIRDKEISRVLIVDDDPAARDSYAYPIEDLELEPVKVEGPVDPGSFVDGVEPCEVVVCDYHLKSRSYSSCDGDELMAACYKAGIPGMLCTAYPDVTIRRDYRRYIPILLKTDSLHPDAFIAAWEQCLGEISGTFLPTRRPWRTLVRIEEIDKDPEYFNAIVFSWDVHKKIRVDKESVPEQIRKVLTPDMQFHFYAEVNIGADSPGDLFFDSWGSEQKTPTFADLLLAIPQDEEEFERLRLPSRTVDF